MKDLSFYKNLIEKDFWPYWEKHIDSEYGGVMNCISNDGLELVSENKYSWSQGRFLWLLSSLYELSINGNINVDSKELKKYMDETINFITDNTILDDYSTVFLLERNGEKILDKSLNRYDTSVYSDCFVILGISKYLQTVKNEDQLKLLISIYENTVRKLKSGDFLTEPYPIPKGYKAHGTHMIMINTGFEFIVTLDKYGYDISEYVNYIDSLVKVILEELEENGLILDFVSNQENKEKLLLDRHVNPGHTLESMWFIIEFLEKYGELDKYLDLITKISKRSFDIGWDEQFGGFLRFVDKFGGEPKGEITNDPYVDLILNTHDMKLWWPHSEGLIILNKLYLLTNDQGILDRYEMLKEYSFSVFPSPSGEWTQIRERDGKPVEKLVALPVKDPFHILRAFIKLMEQML